MSRQKFRTIRKLDMISNGDYIRATQKGRVTIGNTMEKQETVLRFVSCHVLADKGSRLYGCVN